MVDPSTLEKRGEIASTVDHAHDNDRALVQSVQDDVGTADQAVEARRQIRSISSRLRVMRKHLQLTPQFFKDRAGRSWVTLSNPGPDGREIAARLSG
jgi:hypothetical protein